MKNILLALAFVLLAPLPSCSMKQMTTNAIGRVATDGIVALEGEEDLAMARNSALPLIKTLEVLRAGNPKDVRTLLLLSRAYGQYAFGFLEEEMLSSPAGSPSYEAARARAELFYRRGRDYGMAALLARGAGKALTRPLPECKKALASLKKKDAAALFWTAFNWANDVNLSLDDPSALIDLPRIEAMIDRVLELDPGFHFGSAHVFKGILAAVRPKMLGGDPTLAGREFGEAMRVAPDYLMTKVLLAQYAARNALDLPLFRKSLNEVLAADPSRPPEGRLANELAKRRAKLLLGMEKKFF